MPSRHIGRTDGDGTVCGGDARERDEDLGRREGRQHTIWMREEDFGLLGGWRQCVPETTCYKCIERRGEVQKAWEGRKEVQTMI